VCIFRIVLKYAKVVPSKKHLLKNPLSQPGLTGKQAFNRSLSAKGNNHVKMKLLKLPD
jgi:hypothetical protein